MNVGDLVQHKRRGWKALILKITKENKSADIMWLKPVIFDTCSTRFLEVIADVKK